MESPENELGKVSQQLSEEASNDRKSLAYLQRNTGNNTEQTREESCPVLKSNPHGRIDLFLLPKSITFLESFPRPKTLLN